MKTLLRLAVALSFVALSGCATTKSRFNQVYPGMSSQEVAQTMEKGPSRAQEFKDGSTAWYYGEDLCVLIRQDKVVAKEQTQARTRVDAVVVSLEDSRKALCAPEGQGEARTEQTIVTPVGTFKGNLDPAAIKAKVLETKDQLVGDSPK